MCNIGNCSEQTCHERVEKQNLYTQKKLCVNEALAVNIYKRTFSIRNLNIRRYCTKITTSTTAV